MVSVNMFTKQNGTGRLQKIPHFYEISKWFIGKPKTKSFFNIVYTIKSLLIYIFRIFSQFFSSVVESKHHEN